MLVSFFSEQESGVARALAIGDASLDWTDRERVAVVYAAALREQALVVGAWRRARPDAPGVLRRRTGGAPCLAGEGITYLSIALAGPSALIECPPDRIMNRNVRGILAGLRALGLSAHYFGRDFLSVDRRPAGMLSWARALDGRVLIEAFLHAERSCLPARSPDEPSHPEPRWLGKAPISLREAGRAPSPSELAEQVARGCAELGGASVERFDPPTAAPGVRAPGPPALAHWSPPQAIPIGWCSAGISLDEGRISKVAIEGDFDQDDAAPERLSAELAGHPPSAERAASAVNATYGRGRCAIEGLSSLQPLLDALLGAYSASGALPLF